MATYTDAFSSGGATLILEVTTQSQSVANNTSYLKCVLKIRKDKAYSSYNNGTANIYMTINGNKLYSSDSFDIRNLSVGSSQTLATKYITVSHNSDGTKSVSCKAYFDSDVSLGTASISKTYTPATIPRKATISTAPNFNDEENPTITYSNKAGSAVETLEACIANSSGTPIVAYRSISKTGSSYTFSLTTAERDSLREASKTTNNLTVRFYVRTTIGGTKYTSYLTKTMSIINASPAASVSVEDTNSSMLALTGDKNKFVKYYSEASFSISATAKKKATISSYEVTCGPLSRTSSSGTFYGVESGTFNFVIRDSRGNTNNQILEKTLINYIKPTITIKNTARDLSGSATIKLSGNYFNGSFGATNNTCTLQYRYKTSGGSYTNYITVSPTLSGNTYSSTFTISGLNYRNGYVVQARIYDRINTIVSKEVSISFLPVFDWSESDFNHNTDVIVSNNKSFQGLETDGSRVNIGYIDLSNVLNIGGGSYPASKVKINAADTISLVSGGNIIADSPIVLNSGNGISISGSNVNITSESINGKNGNFSGTLEITGRTTVRSAIQPSTNNLIMCGTSTDRWSTVYTNDIDAAGRVDIAGQLWALNVYSNTTSEGRTVRVGQQGRFRALASSSKTIKHDIIPLKSEELKAELLYSIPVVQFKYNVDALNKEDSRYLKDMPGFIAEDIAEIYPIAADMDNGKPSDWNYRFLIPPMLKLIQEQKKQIDSLEERVKVLESC